jgi:hypothetical protein
MLIFMIRTEKEDFVSHNKSNSSQINSDMTLMPTASGETISIDEQHVWTVNQFSLIYSPSLELVVYYKSVKMMNSHKKPKSPFDAPLQ